MSGNSVACSNQAPIISVPPGSGNYQWFNGSTPVTGATSNTFSPSSSGNFSVQITNGPNCFAQSFSKSITINASPTLNIISSTSLICVGDAATLTASGANGTYTWTGGSNNLSIVVSPIVNTTYTLDGANMNGCSSAVAYTQTVSICTSLDELVSSNNFILYPNPARSSITIKISSSENAVVKIFNAIGQVVLTVDNYQS
ncbi:MAG: T9SS type A sorting domain-containing protein [Bacteroidota bacterium]|nr:T9SS type A sorting domain-containing protein [Bacteroidota bacterium]